MTKTLFARGGALSALALVLALTVTPVAAEAQNRDGARAERQQQRAERQQVRSEARAVRQQTQQEPRPQQQQRVAPPQRAERAERPERAQPRPDRGGFGADVMRRAERAGEPDARPVSVMRDNRRAPTAERRAETVDRRSERRADVIDRRSERRADTVERRGDRVSDRLDWQGRERAADRVDRRTDRRADVIEDRGDRRAGVVERRGDRRADRIERDGRRDDNGRDGRRDGNWRDDRGQYRRDNSHWRRDDWRRNYSGWNGWDRSDFRRWDSRWRGNRAYNWADYRRGNNFHFRPGAYFAPYRSHRYSRFQTGFYLDSLFFQPRFFINDPWSYRLPPVYGPYQWVRYYDDVMLVDIYTGEVVDVIYDFFW